MKKLLLTLLIIFNMTAPSHAITEAEADELMSIIGPHLSEDAFRETTKQSLLCNRLILWEQHMHDPESFPILDVLKKNYKGINVLSIDGIYLEPHKKAFYAFLNQNCQTLKKIVITNAGLNTFYLNLGIFKNLDALDLSSNHLTFLPAKFGRKPSSLKFLNLSENPLIAPDLRFWQNFSTALSLDIRDTTMVYQNFDIAKDIQASRTETGMEPFHSIRTGLE